jgi:hypothetical protein
MNNLQNNMIPFTPTKLNLPPTPLMNFEHYAMPMVHLTTGKTISSYKRLMTNPITADMWQTDFGMDFGSMCQGDNKTGAKGKNAMFMMKLLDISYLLALQRSYLPRNRMAIPT